MYNRSGKLQVAIAPTLPEQCFGHFQIWTGTIMQKVKRKIHVKNPIKHKGRECCDIFQIFDYKMYGSGQSRKAQPLADETKYQF